MNDLYKGLIVKVTKNGWLGRPQIHVFRYDNLILVAYVATDGDVVAWSYGWDIEQGVISKRFTTEQLAKFMGWSK